MNRLTQAIGSVLLSLIGAAAWMPHAQAQEVIRLTAASGHPPVFTWVRLTDTFFMPEVDRRLAANGRYRIEWNRAWGGSLIKLGAESKGVSDGLTDLGFVTTLFEAARFPLQNVSYVAPSAPTTRAH